MSIENIYTLCVDGFQANVKENYVAHVNIYISVSIENIYTLCVDGFQANVKENYVVKENYIV